MEVDAGEMSAASPSARPPSDQAAPPEEWYGSSEDDDPPEPASLALPGEVWKKHLTASWLHLWLKLDSYDGTTKGRQQLLDEKLAPRVRARTGRPNPRLERGKCYEPVARESFAKFAGLEMGVDITMAPLAEHRERPYVAAKADGLIGKDGVLEIKTPWSARTDPDVEVTLETKHLLQVYTQMECYDRDYAIVLMSACSGEWLHVWKIFRDCPEYHCITHGELPLWETMLPELDKYATAMRNGGWVDPLAGEISVTTHERIRAAMHRWSRQAVFKLCVRDPDPSMNPPGQLPRWSSTAAAGSTRAPRRTTRPSSRSSTALAVEQDVTLRRFTRVWWRFENEGDKEPKFSYPPVTGLTSGGYIRPEYYYVRMHPNWLRTRTLWIP